MKHYVVKFEVAMIVVADDPSIAVYDAKSKLADIEGIEASEDTDVFALEELLGLAQQNFTKLRKIEREE